MQFKQPLTKNPQLKLKLITLFVPLDLDASVCAWNQKWCLRKAAPL
jgi:hypothetical protein